MEANDLKQQVAGLNLLNPGQRELVESDIENLERALYGQAMGYSGRDMNAQAYAPGDGALAAEPEPFMGRTPPNLPEPELVRSNLRMDRITLDRGTAPDLSGHRKNVLYQMYKGEVEKYKEGLLSEKQMWEPTYLHIQQFVRHQEANQQRAKFIGNVRRILEPHEEGFSVEALRPYQPVPVDFALFRDNFDNIQWTEEEEVRRQVDELDDELYRRFLELKIQTSESSVIMTKLTIDRVTYDACEARLQGQHEQLGEEYGPPAPSPPDVDMKEVEAVIQAVVANPGLDHKDLIKAVDFKAIGITMPRFKKALKSACEAGFIELRDKQYFISEELTRESPSLQEAGEPSL